MRPTPAGRAPDRAAELIVFAPFLMLLAKLAPGWLSPAGEPGPESPPPVPPARRPRRGAAAVELAVLLPFLLLLAVISTDWARLLYYTVSLEGCARAGALYASDDDYQRRTAYLYKASGETEDQALTKAALAECPNLNPTPTITKDTGTDADGHAVVTVTASMTFTTITSVPGVPATQTLTRRVQLRVVPTLN